MWGRQSSVPGVVLERCQLKGCQHKNCHRQINGPGNKQWWCIILLWKAFWNKELLVTLAGNVKNIAYNNIFNRNNITYFDYFRYSVVCWFEEIYSCSYIQYNVFSNWYIKQCKYCTTVVSVDKTWNTQVCRLSLYNLSQSPPSTRLWTFMRHFVYC